MRSASSTYSTYFNSSSRSSRHGRLDVIDEEVTVETRHQKKPNAKVFLTTVGFLFGILFVLNDGKNTQSEINLSLHRSLRYEEKKTQSLPKYTTNFADITESLKAEDQPFFWYIPKSGGSTLQKIFGQCIGLVSCSAFGKDNGLSEVGVYRHSYENTTLGLYVNADPSTVEGIDRVGDLHVVDKRVADVYITQQLAYSQKLFSASHNARMFTMLRQPVKRIIDQFYYRQRAVWDPNFDPELASMSLEAFANSDKLIENFVVRSLVDLRDPDVDVTPADVDVAKEILRKKFVVGLIEWYDLSVIRFEKYFGWFKSREVLTNQTVNYCHHRKINDDDHNEKILDFENHEIVFKKLAMRNWADIELYNYAKLLFIDQENLIQTEIE